MKKNLQIFIYFTGLGWEIMRKHKFLRELCPKRYPVISQLGCSHTVLSTVLTGQPPTKHRQFSSCYFHRKGTFLEAFQNLFRGNLLKKSGYLGTYIIPWRGLFHFVAHNHHKNALLPGNYRPIKSIVDFVDEHNLPSCIKKIPPGGTELVFRGLQARMKLKNLRFAFIQIDDLDPILHREVNNQELIGEKLAAYEKKILRLADAGGSRYENFGITILSGHGMTPVKHYIDIKTAIGELGLDYQHDYISIYDPTMARFWFMNKRAESIIIDRLRNIPHSRLLSDDEKSEMGIGFEDNLYGDTILLVEPGWQISPNDTLKENISGMHGYNPAHKDSLGAVLSNTDIPEPPQWVGNFYDLMIQKTAQL
jgi:hypothetical protein